MNKTIYIIIIVLVAIIGVAFYKLNYGDVPASVGGNFKNNTVPAVLKNDTTDDSYSMAEVARHNSAGDCWMVINNYVINATDFIASEIHNPEIVRGCGIDATVLFEQERKHKGGEAQSLFKKFTIGTLRI